MVPRQEDKGKCCKVKEDTLIVSKENFLYFMAEVINCTFQTKHRSEKTAIVVKSASRYLDIKGITWEQVYGELKNKERLKKDEVAQSQA